MENFRVLTNLLLPMKKERQFYRFTSVAISMVVCLLAIQSAQCKEPYYKGHPLSNWLCCAPPDDQLDAFRNIGTNAIPMFLDILGATPRTIKWVAARMESSGMREQFLSDDDDVAFVNLKEIVVLEEGFVTLNTNAESAIPQLVRLLNKDNEDISPYAAGALALVGPKGFDALTNEAASKSPTIRSDVALGVGQYGQDSNAVSQILIGLLKDKDAGVRQVSALFMHGDPKIAVPALIPMLSDNDPAVVKSAAVALSSYGAKALAAEPEMFSLYTNGFDYEILEYLKRIDLGAAEMAETCMINSGPLTPARKDYTKTELKDGLELIAGGYIHTEFPFFTNRYLASAEIYDPKTGKWIEAGRMTATRSGHAAVLLPNGKVIVAGGYDGKGHDLSSAELFDPETKQWTKTSSMKQPHFVARGTLLPNGKALIFIQMLNGQKVQFEEYDPSSEAWTTITK